MAGRGRGRESTLPAWMTQGKVFWLHAGADCALHSSAATDRQHVSRRRCGRLERAWIHGSPESAGNGQTAPAVISFAR